MSNFNNFDIDQMSSKLAQRWHFVSNFHCKKIIIIIQLKTPKDSFFWTPDIKSVTVLLRRNLCCKRLGSLSLW